MKTLKVIVEKTKTGYSAYSEDFEGVVSIGKTWDELKKNFSEALEFHLEGLEEENIPVPKNYKLSFSLDISQLFEQYSIFNVSSLAEYLKLNKQLLHQYKDGHKNPSEKTSIKIIQGLHRFGNELLMNF